MGSHSRFVGLTDASRALMDRVVPEHLANEARLLSRLSAPRAPARPTHVGRAGERDASLCQPQQPGSLKLAMRVCHGRPSVSVPLRA